jgi:hypothetical protein
VLHGGLVRISHPTLKFLSVNIALRRSNDWLRGTLFLNQMSYYRLLPSQDYRIEIKNIKDNYILAVNEKVISQSTGMFGYTIHIDLNKAVTDRPYADFYKYY